MYTPLRWIDGRLMLSAATLLFSMSCIATRKSEPVVRTTPVHELPTTNEPSRGWETDRDLLLFGQGSVARDLSFETRAASNLQQHTTASDGADFDPHVDPTGKTLVFASTRHARVSHLYTKPVDGATMTQITDEQANDAQPVYSPDGNQIAFCSDRAGHWDIWVIDADGRNSRQITDNPLPELHPSWSPDGRRLVYCRVNPREGRGELWVAEIDNPGIKRLIGEGLFPSWSPQGNRIAYQRARSRGSRWFSIWTVQLEENEALFPTEVASSAEAALIGPSWSPDGSQLTFSWVHGGDSAAGGDPRVGGQGRADIGVVDADGRGLQRLTSGSGENFSPHWGSDGRIYFTAKRQGSETIWSLRPFRPIQLDQPPSLSRNRQAAQVFETAVQE